MSCGNPFAEHVHVYGFDLEDNGQLGPGTIRRLRVALQYQQKTNARLLVSATISPEHEKLQPQPMRELMRDWLLAAGATDVGLLEATEFNTQGEAIAFTALPAARKRHCSSWWHIPRIYLLQRRCEKYAEQVRFLPVWELPSLKMVVLEAAKLLVCMLPAKAQQCCGTVARRMFGRTSY